MGITGRLTQVAKACRNALLTPAEDPREVYGTPYQRQEGRPGGKRLDPGDVRKVLESGFSKVNSDVGLKALQDLAYEYEHLLPVVGRMPDASIPELVDETYLLGLNLLGDALELTISIHAPDTEKIEAEVSRLKREIESMHGGRSQRAQREMREEAMASHRELLDMIKQQQLRVDELLHQCDRCQASLHRTRIELTALRADASGASVSAATETLTRTIQKAREVQAEIRGLGF